MARWCTLTSLLLVSLGLPGIADAQSYPVYDPQVAPAGHAHAGQKAKLRSEGPLGPLPAGPGRTIYEQLPDDQGWLYDDTPLERMLKNTFRHATFRVDYLNWTLSEPGNNLIGAGTDIVNLTDLSPNDPTNILYPSQPGDPFLFQPFINPVTPFQISNPIDQNQSYIAVVQPSLADVRLNSNNGIRGTFSLPIATHGSLEASVFILQTSNSPIKRLPNRQFDIYDSDGDGIPGEVHGGLATGEFDRNGNGRFDDVVDDFQAFATPILVDGQIPLKSRVANIPPVGLFRWPSITNPLSPGTEIIPADPTDPTSVDTIQPIPGRGDNFRILWAIRNPTNPNDYISTYNASLKSSLWGSEFNFVLDPVDYNSPLSIQPFSGFRYVAFGEELRQSGLYTTTLNGVEFNANRRIDSTATNNLYGPQIGLRSELQNRWFTLGVQPKVMLGLNTYRTNLETENVLSANDNDQILRKTETGFGVIGDLEAYTRLHITQNLSLQVGYNLMWVGQVTRPYDNIVYNARTVTTPNGDGTVTNSLLSDFRLDPKFSGLLIQGLNIGGELKY